MRLKHAHGIVGRRRDINVSRRIERDDERRRLREHVERYRPKNLGFIVRTASGKGQSEKRIKQDIDYLSRLWNEIREKAASVTAPALVYEDLNSVLRAIRDWVTEWLEARRGLLAAVHSRVLPEADVVLMNPRHPDVENVQPLVTRPFSFAECLHTPPMLARYASGGSSVQSSGLSSSNASNVSGDCAPT